MASLALAISLSALSSDLKSLFFKFRVRSGRRDRRGTKNGNVLFNPLGGSI